MDNVTVAEILERDEATEGGGGGAVAVGQPVVGQPVVGPPAGDLMEDVLPQYGMVPELIIATTMDAFNNLLVRLSHLVVVSRLNGFLYAGGAWSAIHTQCPPELV